MNSGYSGGAPFEYVIAEKKTAAVKAKKLVWILIYILWGSTILLLGTLTRLFVYLIALVPVTTWMLVFFTWRYTQKEFEYSFFQGELTVTKVWGGRTRREMLRVRIKTVEKFLPVDEKNGFLIDKFAAQKILHAESSPDAPELYALMWQDENGTRTLLFAELNERGKKIIDYYMR